MAVCLRIPKEIPPCFERGDQDDWPGWEDIRRDLEMVAKELQDYHGDEEVDAMGWDEYEAGLADMCSEEEPGSEESSSDDRTDTSRFPARKRVFHLHDKLSKKKKPHLSKDEENTKVKVGLLNVRSLNNKSGRIRALIEERSLDMCLLTETWLRDNADNLLRDACPPNFRFHHKDRAQGRGGGVASLFSDEFQHARIDGHAEAAFECLAVELLHTGWDQSVLVINVYRPPRQGLRNVLDFCKAFGKVFRDSSRPYDCVLVAGDFNFHFERENRISNALFKSFLWLYGLDQHVDRPTHQSGHTLDLVLTTNVEISDLSIENDNIADHYTVYSRARPNMSLDRHQWMNSAKARLRRYLRQLRQR
ncbi:uncharacterized protein LOC134458771 [Engraulis encrasicolus]|uniref:uncharacterized protein LOC134458771 n=1 Tax=Engraulis encrasicolus TaxID=184585 RepID=UPI002FD5B780